MMLGVKADEVIVITDVDEIINDNAIVCIYEKEFSKRKKYFGLMGMDLLERRERNEYFADIKK